MSPRMDHLRSPKAKNYFQVDLQRPDEQVESSQLTKEQKELRAMQELQKYTRDYMDKCEEARRVLLLADYPKENVKDKRFKSLPRKPNVPAEMERRAARGAGAGAARLDNGLDDGQVAKK